MTFIIVKRKCYVSGRCPDAVNVIIGPVSINWHYASLAYYAQNYIYAGIIARAYVRTSLLYAYIFTYYAMLSSTQIFDLLCSA